ncbi:hypothetical protein D3C83_231350 [compost metagenome]
MCSRDCIRQSAEFAICVQQLALRRRAQQRLMLMLAVNVDQQFTRFPQLGKGDRPAVDERARSAARALDAAPHKI